MMSLMWPQAVRDAPMARLFHLIKRQELKHKTASLALKVTANTLLINCKKKIAYIFVNCSVWRLFYRTLR